MSYLDAVLQPNEVVKHRGQLHWIIFWRGIVPAVLGVVLLAIGGAGGGVPFAVGLLLLAIGAVLLIEAWLRRFTTEIAVTDRRVIYKTGLIRRMTDETNIDKVESVAVNQSVLGRVLDYGEINVRGTGGGMEAIAFVAGPLRLRSAITVR